MREARRVQRTLRQLGAMAAGAAPRFSALFPRIPAQRCQLPPQPPPPKKKKQNKKLPWGEVVKGGLPATFYSRCYR